MNSRRLAPLALVVVLGFRGPVLAQTETPPPSPTVSPYPGFAAPEPSGAANWTRRIDRLAGRNTSVAVGLDGTLLYRHRDDQRRTPASNEKLLLSMAILDELGPDHIMETRAAAADVDGGVVQGNLWVIGSGDPEVGRSAMGALARRLDDAGISRVEGRVMGSRPPFTHDWDAPGWKPYFPQVYVALPTALTFEGNTAGGTHIRDPERRAAAALKQRLKEIGIPVTGKAGDGTPPPGLTDLAEVPSAPLEAVLRRQNVASRNFYAETLGKLLGFSVFGQPGTIAKGANAIEAHATSNGVALIAKDSSGLSYDDRVSPEGMVQLLFDAEDSPWGLDLRDALPHSGQGTLGGRLAGVKVRAKTGTLTNISALSGWVQLESNGEWAAFSIISRGISKDAAIVIEDRIVRIVANGAP